MRDPATIVAAPGTQALIQLLPRLVPSSARRDLGPTYEEHEVCWARHGHEVSVVDDVAQAATPTSWSWSIPNNPTGRLLSPAELGAVTAACWSSTKPSSTSCRAEASLAGNLPPRTVVLRSFGKTYGLAGLRLGFAIASPELIARLREELGPWAVSGPALEIGRKALADGAWLRRPRARLAPTARASTNCCARPGFEIVGGTPLFRLARHRRCRAIVERLGRQGIHVRAFAACARQLRFGLPGDDEAFRRLAAALGV